MEQVARFSTKANMGTETQQRRAANRRTLIVLGMVALAFYIGIMVILMLR